MKFIESFIRDYIAESKILYTSGITLRSLLEIDEHLLCQNQLEMETASEYTPLAVFHSFVCI